MSRMGIESKLSCSCWIYKELLKKCLELVKELILEDSVLLTILLNKGIFSTVSSRASSRCKDIYGNSKNNPPVLDCI